MGGKTRKYYTCPASACRHYVFYNAQTTNCCRCGATYSDGDVSHWQGSTWLRSGTQDKDKAGAKDKGANKGEGKGG